VEFLELLSEGECSELVAWLTRRAALGESLLPPIPGRRRARDYHRVWTPAWTPEGVGNNKATPADDQIPLVEPDAEPGLEPGCL